MNAEDITREMAELYNGGMTLEQVGKRFGMTRQGVRHRFMIADIIRRHPKNIDKDRLEALYSKERLPIFKIAADFSVSENKIRKALKSYEIPRRKPLKLGGYKVDILRSLKIGEKRLIKWHNNKEYARLYTPAKLLGMKVSIRSRGNGKFEVTRLK